jgi:hypothetical protein
MALAGLIGQTNAARSFANLFDRTVLRAGLAGADGRVSPPLNRASMVVPFGVIQELLPSLQSPKSNLPSVGNEHREGPKPLLHSFLVRSTMSPHTRLDISGHCLGRSSSFFRSASSLTLSSFSSFQGDAPTRPSALRAGRRLQGSDSDRAPAPASPLRP